jgi:predicted DNA-binding ribbon-helix-helix protein
VTSKPAPIRWLEAQTGQAIDYTPAPSVRDRHLSVRLTNDLSAALDAMAAARGVVVSQLVRQILEAEVARSNAVTTLDERALVERVAQDVAELRRRLAG